MKSLIQSKTFWVNLIMAVLSIVSLISPDLLSILGLNTAKAMTILGVVTALLNIILRMITNTGINTIIPKKDA